VGDGGVATPVRRPGPLTRIAAAETSFYCSPLPVGEGRYAPLHVQQGDASLSHRERAAAERRLQPAQRG